MGKSTVLLSIVTGRQILSRCINYYFDDLRRIIAEKPYNESEIRAREFYEKYREQARSDFEYLESQYITLAENLSRYLPKYQSGESAHAVI